MRTKTANVKLDWQPSKFGGPKTICVEITKRVTAIVCPHYGYVSPFKPTRASISVGGTRVAFEYCKSIEQGKQWVEASLPNIALQMAEDADNLLSALGMKERTNEPD